MYDGPGIYRHYKGGLYEVIGIALVEATLDPVVVYRPLDKGPRQPFMEGLGATMWTRPREDFDAMVRPDVESVQTTEAQFEKPDSLPPMRDLSPEPVPRFVQLSIHEILTSRNERLLDWARIQMGEENWSAMGLPEPE